jgi:hypothetical protein
MIVETFYNVPSACVTGPATVTEWRTMWLSGSGYPAAGVSYTIPSDTLVTYTFQELLLILLKPGDVLTQVQ